VVNGYFVVHAPRPPTETSIETAEQLAPHPRAELDGTLPRDSARARPR
jgi:hypothetical protein